jgi:hypothetical protein
VARNIGTAISRRPAAARASWSPSHSAASAALIAPAARAAAACDGSRLAQVRARLDQLKPSEKMLEHGLRCRHPDHRACPRFRKMVLARVGGVAVAEAMDHD